MQRGSTVRLAHLSQNTVEITGRMSVLESLEEVRGAGVLGDGQEITAASLCKRFGFRGALARTPVDELSGGERRRLALSGLATTSRDKLGFASSGRRTPAELTWAVR